MSRYYFTNRFAKREYKANKRKLPIIRSDSFIFDSKLVGKEIIPIYKSLKFKRRYLIGNVLKIEDEKQVLDYFDELRKQFNAIETYKVKGVSKKTFMLDVIYLTSIPLAFLVFPIKKHYLCDKKIIKETLKDKCLIAPNHTSAYDAPFVYMSTMWHRIRMISLIYVFKIRICKWAFLHAGVIPYDRDKGFDLNCFREANGILEGGGQVVLFPQGHVVKPGDPVNNFQPGLAMFSLRNNAPIIMYYYKTPNRAFRQSQLIIDKPIYPSDYFGKDYKITNELVEKFTKILEDKFLYYETHTIEELKENAK